MVRNNARRRGGAQQATTPMVLRRRKRADEAPGAATAATAAAAAAAAEAGGSGGRLPDVCSPVKVYHRPVDTDAPTPKRPRRAQARSDRGGIAASATQESARRMGAATRSGATNATANVLSADNELQDEEDAEAQSAVQRHLIDDIDGVLDAARPATDAQRAWAQEVSGRVYQELEDYISKHKRQAGAPKGRRGRQSENRSPAAADRGAKQTAAKDGPHAALVRWTSMDPAAFSGREPEMYPWICAFLGFVAAAIKSHSSSGNQPADTKELRSLASFPRTEVAAADADNNKRPDIVLTGDPGEKGWEGDGRPHYAGALLVVEVKRRSNENQNAIQQIYKYTRDMYAAQPNRRFAWGLAVCGTAVKAAVFGSDKIFYSRKMDVASSAGRANLVRLLTDWSMCERSQLGYDRTMRYRDGTWHIDVCDDETGVNQTYAIDKRVFGACTTFGRHTRCFAARRVQPGPATGGDQLVLIKDAWAQVDGDGGAARDEIAHLREITGALRDSSELAGKFPQLVSGGVVRVKDDLGRAKLDTTELLADSMGLDLDKHGIRRRVHRRLAMTPVAQPLQCVQSPDELIVVLADAMEAHAAILERCGILHSDLSTGNILVHHDSNGRTTGTLIDFDYAIRVGSDEGEGEGSGRTGTLPYMSICCLDGRGVRRTALDDYESLIYIMCWLGTIGINYKDQKKAQSADNKRRTIKDWREGSPWDIAGRKQGHVGSTKVFAGLVLSGFLGFDGYEHLKTLARKLHKSLFYNKRLSPSSQGCWPAEEESGAQTPPQSNADFYDANVAAEIIDPFARRAEVADEIARDLLNTLKEARGAAQKRMAGQ